MSTDSGVTLVLPSQDDPVVAGAVQAIGGPPGSHARLFRSRFWNPLRVLLALCALTCLLGYAQKEGCRSGSNWQHEYQYTRACYTDVIALYNSEGLADGKTPYYQHPVEYPVVIGGVMAASAGIARTLAAINIPADTRTSQATDASSRAYAQSIARGRHFYDVTWIIMTLCAMAVTVGLAKIAGRRPWDGALFALSPALLLHVTTNWDLIAVMFATLGMLAWARKHPVWAGVLLGLGTATKLYPILFLVPLLGLCWRARRMSAWTSVAAATVITAVGLTLPFYLTAPAFTDDATQSKVVSSSPLDRVGHSGLSGLLPIHCTTTVTSTGARSVSTGRCPTVAPLGSTQVEDTNAVYRFFDLNQTRGADWDSLYLQIEDARGWFGGTTALNSKGPVPVRLNHLVEGLEVVVFAGILALALWAPRRPRLPQLLFLAAAGFLLVNKVDSPQYVLWLVPLAVLARPRWRLFLAWQITEVFVLLSRFYFFIANDKPGQGIDIRWFFACVLARDLLILIYAGFVLREMFRPELDVVRADGVDDPAGGVLDRAPDRADSYHGGDDGGGPDAWADEPVLVPA